MAYQSKARRTVRDTREPIAGSGKLPVSVQHRVTITDMIFEGRFLNITFQDAFDNTHEEKLFLLSQDSTDVGGKLKQLIAAIAPSSEAMRIAYDCILEGDERQIDTMLMGSACGIETEYRDNFINIKTIRSINDRDNSGSFVQSPEANQTHKTGAANPGERKRYIPVSNDAANFF